MTVLAERFGPAWPHNANCAGGLDVCGWWVWPAKKRSTAGREEASVSIEMARIVAVHGIGQQLEGPDTQEECWRAPLISGIRLAGGPPVDPVDVSVAFYGDLFRKRGAKRFGEREFSSIDVTDDFDRELLAEWAQAVTAAEESGSPEKSLPTKVRTPHAVQRCLQVLSRSRFFAGAADRVVIWNLRQVRSYFTDDAIRNDVQKRVEETVGPDTRLLIGHSLGSVVAYEALAAHPEWPVRRLSRSARHWALVLGLRSPKAAAGGRARQMAWRGLDLD